MSVERFEKEPFTFDENRVRRLIDAAVVEAEASGQSQAVVFRVDLESVHPISAFKAMTNADRFFWLQPERKVSLVAQGEVLGVETSGSDRFRQSESLIANAMKRVHCLDARTRDAIRWLGGFSFADSLSGQGEWSRFSAGRLSLPSLLFSSQGDEAHALVAQRLDVTSESDSVLSDLRHDISEAVRLSCNNEVEGALAPSGFPELLTSESGPEYAVTSDRPHEVYCEQVAGAIEAIGLGEFEKVVMARSLEVRHPERYEIISFLQRLSSLYPSCTVMAIARGEHTLVAASPEFLVSLDQGEVKAHALAGSAARGSSPAQDEALGLALMESKKEQNEHAAVVRAVKQSLFEVCGPLQGPEAPGLLKMEGIQHLSTPLRGQLRDAERTPSVLRLVELLHPTPAVCGLPRESARTWLDKHEQLDRGWYAGPVGWVGPDGDGEFWVALRAGLIRQSEEPHSDEPALARLFAGAGIVQGSRPESELAETRLKLRALLAPLTEI